MSETEVLHMFDLVGFIGVGTMGTPMAEKIIAAGYKVVAFDSVPEALERARDFGAEIAASPCELAERCNPIITMLPNSNIVEKVVLGPRGIIEGARAGTILIDMSTAYPMSTMKIAEELSSKGMEMLDAPVSGGLAKARQGTLSIMVGGKAELVEQCRPLFQVMGKEVFHMGSVGSGHIMKAVNNVLNACNVAATAEVMTLATKAGLNARTVVAVLQASTGKNWATECKFPKFVLTRTFDDGFRMDLLMKDLDIAATLARDLNVPMFIASTIHQIFGLGISQGYGEKGHTTIVQLMEKWAGTTIEG